MVMPQISLDTVVSVFNTAINLAGKVGGAIIEIANKIAPYVEKIGLVVQTISTLLGIIKPEDKTEDLGQAMRESSKKPEDFDSINNYIEHLRDEIKSGNIDINKPKTDNEKIADMALGVAIAIKAIDEKYALTTNSDFWTLIGLKIKSDDINADEVQALLESSKESGIDIKNIANYIKGDKVESGVKASDVSELIENSLEKANPNMSDEEIASRFNKLLEK